MNGEMAFAITSSPNLCVHLRALSAILVDNGPLRWVPTGTSLQIVLSVRSWA